MTICSILERGRREIVFVMGGFLLGGGDKRWGRGSCIVEEEDDDIL
jgi:hypothetical protein